MVNGEFVRVARLNIATCFPDLTERARARLTKDNLRQTGRFVTELGLAWGCDDDRWRSTIERVDGVDVIDEAQQRGVGVLVLAPHFGNWEILNLYLGERYAVTALYDPPRIVALDAPLRARRTRTGSTLVPTNLAGVRSLRATLARGGVAALLPDQVPRAASGRYVRFFGRQALTMTLAYRLSRKLGARVVLAFARRTSSRVGFEIGFMRLPDVECAQCAESALVAMNAAIEALVRSDPAQYQWQYKRFKRASSESDRLY